MARPIIHKFLDETTEDVGMPLVLGQRVLDLGKEGFRVATHVIAPWHDLKVMHVITMFREDELTLTKAEKGKTA
jgi:hypothetical protein